MIVHFDPHLMPADQNVKLRAKNAFTTCHKLTSDADCHRDCHRAIHHHHHHLSLPTLGISDVIKASKKIYNDKGKRKRKKEIVSPAFREMGAQRQRHFPEPRSRIQCYPINPNPVMEGRKPPRSKRSNLEHGRAKIG